MLAVGLTVETLCERNLGNSTFNILKFAFGLVCGVDGHSAAHEPDKIALSMTVRTRSSMKRAGRLACAHEGSPTWSISHSAELCSTTIAIALMKPIVFDQTDTSR